MDDKIYVLYYDLKTIDLDFLQNIANGLKGFFGNKVIFLPIEVNLQQVEKEILLEDLKAMVKQLEELDLDKKEETETEEKKEDTNE